MDFSTVPNPVTPTQVLSGLIENAIYDDKQDVYTIKLSGDLVRLWITTPASEEPK